MPEQVSTGFHPKRGKYYRFGKYGTIYYVEDHGTTGAMNLAYAEERLYRAHGGYRP